MNKVSLSLGTGFVLKHSKNLFNLESKSLVVVLWFFFSSFKWSIVKAYHVEKLLSFFWEIGSILNSTAFCRDKFFCVIKSFNCSIAVIIFVVFLAFQAKFTFAALLPWFSGDWKITWVINSPLDFLPLTDQPVPQVFLILWRRFVIHFAIERV